MCLHSVLNLSLVERVKKCRFSNTNKNQNRTRNALGKNTILLGFGYSTLTFMSKRAPRGGHTRNISQVDDYCKWNFSCGEMPVMDFSTFCLYIVTMPLYKLSELVKRQWQRDLEHSARFDCRNRRTRRQKNCAKG